jgi:hypothetical protein
MSGLLEREARKSNLAPTTGVLGLRFRFRGLDGV